MQQKEYKRWQGCQILTFFTQNIKNKPGNFPAKNHTSQVLK